MAPTYDCEICLSPFSSSTFNRPIPGCGHYHCPRCLSENLAQSLRTIPFRPPTCCNSAQYIPPSVFRRLPSAVPQETIHFYRQKITEYESLARPPRFHRALPPRTTQHRGPLQVLVTIPTYCHDPKCGAFIPDILSGKCRKCKKRTCERCKVGFHLGEACWKGNLDTAEHRTEMRRLAAVGALRLEKDRKGRAGREKELWEMTRKLMGQMGWKRCPRCKAGVEKTEGCNHITCLCGVEWCYRCEGLWGPGHRMGVGACAG
ncbi:hypothetical protein QBC40DRAFT_254894 [Triangularia verruculosa]|uniref:RING-type domain-containing protein n=1 Tax=Triangularia verruculosa TaxID=2587418 RepID=A0AAN6XHA6_9PEZI|nr:hypothetical protein QBC40DRAFT_254894 [Triangularia verruculosa]